MRFSGAECQHPSHPDGWLYNHTQLDCSTNVGKAWNLVLTDASKFQVFAVKAKISAICIEEDHCIGRVTNCNSLTPPPLFLASLVLVLPHALLPSMQCHLSPPSFPLHFPPGHWLLPRNTKCSQLSSPLVHLLLPSRL